MLLLNNISTKYASLLIHNLNQFVFFNDAVNQCGLFMPLQPSCLTVSCKIKTCCVGGLHNSQKKKKQKNKKPQHFHILEQGSDKCGKRSIKFQITHFTIEEPVTLRYYYY